MPVIFMLAGCVDEGAEVVPRLALAVADRSCTEIWLALSAENVNGEIILKQDSLAIDTLLANGKTEIYVDSLRLNSSYSFNATAIADGKAIASDVVTARTLDTTSHDWTFVAETLGVATSVLHDVAIISEDNIWAVGELYLNDSTGRIDPIPYNAVQWDGATWNFIRIQFYTICGQQSRTSYPASSICAFNDTDIWVSSRGGQIAQWNGTTQTATICNPDPFAINKLWGESPNSVWAVGNNGGIAHYQAGTWQRVESGTTTDLTDIYGENGNIFVAGYRDFQPSVLLRLNNGTTRKIIEDNGSLFEYRPDFISGAMRGVWVKRTRLFALTWFDVYRSQLKTEGEGEAMWRGAQQDWGMVSMRGNEANDIIACGALGRIWHYNGVNWQRFPELEDPRDMLYRIAVKGDRCVAVGYRYNNGVERFGLIRIGHR